MKGLFLIAVFMAIFTFKASAAQEVNQALLLASKPAKKLSDYALFSPGRNGVPAKRVMSYTLNNPLFTDYAIKYRFLYLPKGAGPAPLTTGEALSFPVGTVLIKSFAYPESFRQPGKAIRFIETRLLVHKKNGWKGYPYVWNEDQTEAYLNVAGKRLEIPVQWANGEKAIIPYAVPNMNQCKGCHVSAEKKLAPIGPKIRNLNRPHEETGLNQITYLQELGYLERGEKKPAELPRVPEPFLATSGSLAERARSYLDGNCAHCHSPGLPADTSGLYLDYAETRPVHWGLNKPPVAAGRGSGGFAVDIAPGKPDRSILLYRMKSTDPGIMMPELGRALVHKEGISLIEDFIRSLDD